MKRITVIVMSIFLHLAFDSTAQQVTLTLNNVPLKEAFVKLKNLTNRSFTYAESDLIKAGKVSIEVKDMALQKVLDILLKGTGLQYVYEKGAIVIRPKAEKKEEGDTVDEHIVRGRVTNEKGEPVVGATVTVKNSNIKISTGLDGFFTLKGIDAKAELVITSIGYEPGIVKLEGKGEIFAKMVVAVKEIEEVEVVVNTGYQEVAKERATGSFVQMDNKLINRKVSTNILDRILEVTSGLNYIPSSGSGGYTKSPLSIRGVSTIEANALPLVVVDGFVYENGGDEYGILNYLKNINPNDVESITILKDAAAASIWGAKAGAGVIVITSKKGKFNQRANVQLVSNITMGQKPDLNFYKVISPSEIVDFEADAFARGYWDGWLTNTTEYPAVPLSIEIWNKRAAGDLSEEEADAQLAALRQHDIRTDLSNYFLQKSINQQYALNVSGGSSGYSYYFSVGYDKNRGNTIGNVDNRYTLRFDNIFRPVKKLELNTYIVHTQTKNFSNAEIFSDYESFMISGIMPQYSQLADEQGNPLPISRNLQLSFVDNPGNPDYLDWHYRPLEELRNNDVSNRQFNTRFGGGLKYTIFKGLLAEVKGQYDKSINNYINFRSLSTFYTRDLINQYLYRDGFGTLQYPVPLGGIKDLSDEQSTSWNIRGQLNFNHRWQNQEIAAIVGLEMREVNTEINSSRRYGYDPATNQFNSLVDYKNYFNINPGQLFQFNVINGVAFSGILNRYTSYYGNASYTWKEKYMVSVSARQDGANLFGVKANQRVNPFWSAGIGWNIFKESFYNIEALPYLKLRASYGFNGNIKNNATIYPTIMYTGNNSLTNALMATVYTPPNPSLRWERVKIKNIALDFATKGNRISGSIEYYRKEALDLISKISVDPTSGEVSYTGNQASIKGNGIDIILNAINNNKVVRWETNFLFSYNTDKVTQLKDRATVLQLVRGTTVVVGKPLYSAFSYRWAGLDPMNGTPRGIVGGDTVDYNTVLSGSNTMPDDLIYHGQRTPKFFGSFRNTFNYKQFGLTANITFKAGYYFRRPSINYSNLYSYSNGHSDYMLRWKKPGDELTSNVPAMPEYGDANLDQFYLGSEILVEKADHIRLQDIRFSYDLTNKVIKRLPFQSASLYVYVNNLGVIWRANKHNIDPDAVIQPIIRTISLGCNLSF